MARDHGVLEACVEVGGTITGEHGVGLDKLRAMRLIFSEREMDAVRRVKAALDHRGLCNAGKAIPDPEPAAAGAGEP